MDFKKTGSSLFTILFFGLLVSSFTSVFAIEEDFSTPSPSPKNTRSQKAASDSAIPKAEVQASTSTKTIVYKGDISATPSAVGKLLVKTDDGEKNVDTDKKTKIFTYTSGKRAVIALNRVKLNDKAVVIGQMTEDNKSLLATHVLVGMSQNQQQTRNAMYGTVSTRDTSGSAFTIKVKSPGKNEEKSFILNANTGIKVKDVEGPKLSDIKIGDRVTFTYSSENDTNTITRIFAIPGRAAGLLRDIRESSEAASPKASATASSSASPRTTTRASATPRATTAATSSASPRAKTTARPSATPAQ